MFVWDELILYFIYRKIFCSFYHIVDFMSACFLISSCFESASNANSTLFLHIKQFDDSDSAVLILNQQTHVTNKTLSSK